MTRNQKDATFDLGTILKDAGLVAASAAAQVGGSNKILDLGAARMDGRVIIDFTAIEVASGDESYNISAQFSSSATFASTVVNGAGLLAGDAAVLAGVDTDTPVGRHEVGVTNEINGTTYRYMRLYTEVGGTIATGVNYSSRLVLE
jgi:hypothetical protein